MSERTTLTAPPAARRHWPGERHQMEFRPDPEIIRPRPGGTLRLSAKAIKVSSLKKAVLVIREHGPEAVAVVLQGNLGAGDVLEQAGISAQVKGARPAA
jgi:hypothetical protein